MARKNNEAARENIIVRTSIIGIGVNVLLALFKAFAGLLASSISIVLDAVNNVSDALSSVITIIGTKLSLRRPNKKHPFGYGRIEYISAVVIAVIVLYAGITSLVESVKKMITPVTPEYSFLTLAIVAVAVLVKIALGLFVRSAGKKTHSDSLCASGTDALFDSIISFSTLAAAIIFLLFGISCEAYLGALISLFIIKSALQMLGETLSRILGERTESALAKDIKETISHTDSAVRGVYDLVLHNYGPDTLMGSVHVEVPDTWTAAAIDELTRKIQHAVYEKHRILLSAVGIYSFNTQNDEASRMREKLRSVLALHPFVLQMHGFYADFGERALSFDIVMDFACPQVSAEYSAIYDEVSALFPQWTLCINRDTDFSD